jgi:hypothetical protein
LGGAGDDLGRHLDHLSVIAEQSVQLPLHIGELGVNDAGKVKKRGGLLPGARTPWPLLLTSRSKDKRGEGLLSLDKKRGDATKCIIDTIEKIAVRIGP